MIRATHVWALFVVLVLVQRARSQSAPQLPPDIRAAIQRNAQLIDPISVEFTQILRPLVPRGSVEEKFDLDPKTQEMYFARRTTKLSLQGCCEYTFESHELPEATALGTRWANNQESAFDGTWIQHGDRNYKDSLNQPMPSLDRMHVQHLVQTQPQDRLGVRDYFRAIGLNGPESWAAKAEKQGLQSTVLKMLASESSLMSVRDETIDGQQLVRIEVETRDPDVARAIAYDDDKANERLEWLQSQIAIKPDPGRLKEDVIRLQRSIATTERLRRRPELRRYIWFLDPARDHTIARYEERSPDGTLLLTGVNSDFFQPSDRKIWLPRKVVENRYGDLSFSRVFAEPALVTEIELKSVDTTPKEPSFFTLSYSSPGSRVREWSAAGALTEQTVSRAGPPDPPPEATQPVALSNGSAGRTIASYAAAACGAVIFVALIAGATARALRRREN